VDKDVYCEKCGYNLRGLPRGTATCPECGAKVSLKRASASQLPWAQRETRGFLDAYWTTVKLVVASPRTFQSELWEGGRLSERDGNKFRWATILHAYVPLLALFVAAVPQLVPRGGGRLVAPVSLGMAVVLLVWLDRSTRLLITFLKKQTMNADIYRRLVALAHYAPASLALSPLHLGFVGLLGATTLITGPQSGPGAAMLRTAVLATWAAFTVFQFAAWWFNSMGLVRAAMAANDAEVFAYGLIFLLLWVVHAAAYLVALPLALLWFAGSVGLL
jgi:hypothetical protein